MAFAVLVPGGVSGVVEVLEGPLPAHLQTRSAPQFRVEITPIGPAFQSSTTTIRACPRMPALIEDGDDERSGCRRGAAAIGAPPTPARESASARDQALSDGNAAAGPGASTRT